MGPPNNHRKPVFGSASAPFPAHILNTRAGPVTWTRRIPKFEYRPQSRQTDRRPACLGSCTAQAACRTTLIPVSLLYGVADMRRSRYRAPGTVYSSLHVSQRVSVAGPYTHFPLNCIRNPLQNTLICLLLGSNISTLPYHQLLNPKCVSNT